MKRFIYGVAVALLLLSLVACDSAESSSEAFRTQGTETEDGYTFVYKNVTINMHEEAAATLDTLGEPIQYFEAPSCAFKGLDKTYTYSGIQLTTYPVDNKDYILGVVIMDDTVSTPEGVSLGDSLDKVKSTYGSSYSEEVQKLTYTKSKSTLTFILENNAVASIEYGIVAE